MFIHLASHKAMANIDSKDVAISCKSTLRNYFSYMMCMALRCKEFFFQSSCRHYSMWGRVIGNGCYVKKEIANSLEIFAVSSKTF